MEVIFVSNPNSRAIHILHSIIGNFVVSLRCTKNLVV
jgi:hypothetical protein